MERPNARRRPYELAFESDSDEEYVVRRPRWIRERVDDFNDLDETISLRLKAPRKTLVMADDQMRRVDLVKDEKLLNAATKEWMKIIEKQNIERVEKLRKLRKKNIITSLLLGTGVIGIYAYSILSVKQETFLDDFEVPQLVPKKEEN